MQRIWLGLILLLGLFLRVGYLWEAVKTPDFYAPLHDAEFKDYWARAILSGDWTPPRNEGNPFMEGYPLPNPPGYPLVLALIYWLTDGSYFAVRIVQIAFAMINILLVYHIAKKLFGSVSALFSALGISVYWAFVFYDLELNQVTFYITLNLLFFYLLFVGCETNRVGYIAFSAVVLGVNSWFRGEIFLLIFPVTFLCGLLFWVMYKKIGRATIISIVFLFCALLPILPITIYNYRLSGTFTPISHTGECSISIAFHPETAEYAPYTSDMLRWLNKTEKDTVEIFDLDGMTMGLSKELGLDRRVTYREWRDYLIKNALNNLLHYPQICLIKIFRRLLWTFSPIELDENKVIYYERQNSLILRYLPRYPVALTLFVVGATLFFISRKLTYIPYSTILPKTWFFATFILLFVGLYIGIFSLIIAGSRYRVPLIPFFFIFGGFACSCLLLMIKQQRWKDLFITITFTVFVFIMANISFLPYSPNRSRWLDERRRCYQRIERYNDGIEFFKRYVKENPEDADAHYHLGLLYVDINNIPKAEEHFLTCLTISPLHSSAPYNLGMIYLQQGRLDLAFDYLMEAVQRNPANADMLFALGWAYELNHDYTKAIEWYERVLAIKENHIQSLSHLGAILYQKGNWTEAKRLLEQALSVKPDYPHAQLNLGQVYLAERNPNMAVRYLQPLVETYQPRYVVLKSLGIAYAQLNQFGQALQYLTRAKQEDPQHFDQDPLLAVTYASVGMNTQAYDILRSVDPAVLDSTQLFNLGCAYERLGEIGKAEIFYLRALEKDPKHSDALAGMGNICLLRGDETRAYEYFEKALRINPTQFGAWFNVILRLLKYEDWQTAKEQLEKFINYYPEYAEAYYNLGLVYQKMGEISEAKRAFDKTLTIQTDHSGALYSQASIALNENDLIKAQELFERLLSFDEFQSHYHLGIIHSIREEWDLAHDHILTSFLLNPAPFYQDPLYAFNLGRIYQSLSCYSDAEYFYRYAFAVAPDFADLNDALTLVLIKQGNIYEAHFHANTNILQFSETPWTFYHLSLIWEKMNELELALHFADLANRILNQPAITLHQLGEINRKLSCYDEAEKYLQLALDLSPNNVQILKSLAFLRSMQARYMDAKKLFEECLQRTSNDPELYEGLGDVHLKIKEIKQAESCYRKSIECQPTPTVIKKLGLLLADLNHIDEGLQLLEKAVEYFPHDAVVLTRLADLKVATHRDEEAKVLYERALEIESENYLSHRNYAELLVRYGDPAAAEKHFREALRIKPDDPIALAGLGLLYAQRGDYESAKEILVPLAQRKTDLFAVNHQLALIFLQEQHPDKAIKYIKRCILAQPDRKEFRELLQQAIGQLEIDSEQKTSALNTGSTYPP